MWTDDLLARYLNGKALDIVLKHSSQVAMLSLDIALRVKLAASDIKFVEEAAHLHDIGVCRVKAPDLGLYGEYPYIMHGVIGREILEHEGYPQHALVCERHTGVGLTCDDIRRQGLPLPARDMCPETLCEEIICFADLFFSKKPGGADRQRSVEEARLTLVPFGVEKVALFDLWVEKFGAVE